SARIRDLSLDRIMGRHHYCQALPFCNDAAEAVVKDWASGQDNPAEHATVTQLKGGDAAALHL
ncbi:MAG: hypothetical protein JO089_05700, partial [Alphaproteobacteria bacterium]|nr:hypothetical protein [Alphaproteobacteria bacterium]